MSVCQEKQTNNNNSGFDIERESERKKVNRYAVFSTRATSQQIYPGYKILKIYILFFPIKALNNVLIENYPKRIFYDLKCVKNLQVFFFEDTLLA